jgi:hypothetical protein
MKLAVEARLLAIAALWVPIQNTQKYKMGNISKGVANTHSSPQKKMMKLTVR